MRIGLAQIKPITGNIEANITLHTQSINTAIANKVDLIIFPELSITGYEPTLAKKLAINNSDQRFDIFQNTSDQNNISIAIGVPSIAEEGITISMLIFQPKLHKTLYSKQNLHKDEFPYFINGDKQIILNINGIKIAPAICYESLQYQHSENANTLGADIYIASVAKSKASIEKATIHYSKTAARYSMPILMVNAIGKNDTFESYGTTSIWNANGNLIGSLDKNTQGLIIYDTIKEKVIEL